MGKPDFSRSRLVGFWGMVHGLPFEAALVKTQTGGWEDACLCSALQISLKVD